MTLAEAISHVRRQIDDIVLAGPALDGPAGTDDQLWMSMSARFSDEDIAQRLESAMYWVVAQVKATHVRDLRLQVAAGSLQNTASFVRLIDESVTVDGVPAKRMNARAAVEMTRSGRMPTADAPAFSFDDLELVSYPAQGVTSAEVIRLPQSIDEVPEVLMGSVIQRCAQLLALSLATHEAARERNSRHGAMSKAYLQGMAIAAQMQPPMIHIGQANDARTT